MYDALKGLAAELLMPLPMMVVAVVVGISLRQFGLRRLGNALCIAAVSLLMLASWAPVADRLLGPLERRYPAMLVPPDAPVESIVVLGGGWQPEPEWPVTAQLSETSLPRLMEGLRLWHARPEALLIVSGGSSQAWLPGMAVGYARAAQALGVPEASLVVLDSARDTGEEARAVRDRLGEGASIVLVTSASHMPRAKRHFEAAGLRPLPAPTHYLTGRQSSGWRYWLPGAEHLAKTERALYEWLGRLVVKWEH
ncbi:envelope biogenesis factor ElyC [Halomonas sp. LBP4]|uniref:envelope biogenesis factor ElyC n=1 Tax=Halomonas sp. LBP4 TaxID=2044917 RepID=UPI000D76F7EC|nr:envelope biogenesis factor ElyC [Halomonas sp. LBP4]PXX97641.1 envelope biogenesis factor ElyC [Halomonas sp. LBP4]